MNTLKRYRLFLALTCLAFLFGSEGAKAGRAYQTETDFTEIDAYVNEQRDNLGIPGLTLAVIQDGQIAHLQGFGTADSSGRPVTPQTPFTLGSVTKPFTALAVMQLVEAGKIDLDAPVQAYLPWFEVADPEASAQITVRHLINMTSGMGTRDGNRGWATMPGLEQEVRSLAEIRLTQPVGTTYQYNNDNFMIAGLLVETVSGQSFGDYVVEHIFEPLEMHHSYADPGAAETDGLAGGHLIAFGHAFSSAEARPPAFLPAGFLMASAEDLAHFALAQLDEGRYSRASILSPEGIAAMHAPEISKNGGGSWGLGWDLNELDGQQIIYRLGDTGRFHATLLLAPESRSGVVLLANASGLIPMGAQLVDQVAIGVLSLLRGQPAAPASVPFVINAMYWGALLAPLLLAAGVLFVWRRPKTIKAWAVLLTIGLNLAVVYLLYNLSTREMPLGSLLVFFPDTGYAVIATILIGVGWSVVLPALYLRSRARRTGKAGGEMAGSLSFSVPKDRQGKVL